MLVHGGVFESTEQADSVSKECAAQLSVVEDARLALRVLPEGAVSSEWSVVFG
jgi:hypothetical protein